MTDAVAAPPRPNNAVGLALVAAFLVLGGLLARTPAGPTPLVFAFVMLGWVLAVMAHEFSHAAVAYLGGDYTARDRGYLSLDPRRYGDVGVSLVIPLIALAMGGIGFPGGAVYLRHDLMRGPGWRAAASLAGPAATLVVMIVLAGLLRLLGDHGDALFPALAMLTFLQGTALVLNLLPIPGLDGFNAIRPFLPAAWAPGLRKAEGLGMLLLLAAVFLLPGFSDLLWGVAALIAAIMGVPTSAMQTGWDIFHFWN